jgi:hypothetical protein
MACPSDGSGMDRLPAIGSSLPSLQARMPETREAAWAQHAPWSPLTDSNTATTVGPSPAQGSATDEEQMLHFISHVNAECFISLLQTMDPLPYDERARTEYKRFYRQLHEVLETPPPLPDPRPTGGPVDPLR